MGDILPARKYKQEIRVVNYCCVTIIFCGVETLYDGYRQNNHKKIAIKYFRPKCYLTVSRPASGFIDQGKTKKGPTFYDKTLLREHYMKMKKLFVIVVYHFFLSTQLK